MTARLNTLTRRMFLLGTGGAALAIPFLPSLLDPREAAAQGMPHAKRYVHLATDHGGIWRANMHPADSLLSDAQMYAGRMIRRGDLTATTQGTDAVLSAVLTAPASALTPALLRKMNVVNGLDVAFYIAHNTGQHLGNYARNDNNGVDGRVASESPRRTIDQIMAWSSSFYADLSNTRLRSICGGRLCWGFSNAVQRTGVIQEITGPSGNAQATFDAVFGGVGGSARRPITNGILASYRRLRDGNTRLSAEDRRRLEDHIAHISELDRQLNVVPVCTGATRPAMNVDSNVAGYSYNPAMQALRWQQYNDVLARAMACGATRLASIHVTDTFSDSRLDWHQEIAHKAHLPTGDEQRVITQAHNRFFRDVVVDLARKLDAIDDTLGRTVLDNSLLSWTQESGPYTHESTAVPVITFGSAAGAVRTGSYIDYRDRNVVVNDGGYQGSTEITHAGLIYNQFLATVLNVMGVPRSEWEEMGGGYGLRLIGTGVGARYDAAMMNNSDSLPFLTPG